jgi:hypothetical protein
MKMRFTALALFDTPFDKIMKRAFEGRFDVIEVLCEGPCLLRHALRYVSQFEIAQ